MLIFHNFEEIQTLCKVVRDENGKVVDPLHKTLPFITCYEKTRIIESKLYLKLIKNHKDNDRLFLSLSILTDSPSS